MKDSIRQLFCSAAMLCILTFPYQGVAQEPAETPDVEAPAPEPEATSESTQLEVESATPNVEAAAEDVRERSDTRYRFGRYREDNVIVHIGDDSHLPADEWADAVISVIGSSTSEGQVDEVVVSVFGNTRVTGEVGEDVVAVFGDNYVNARIGGDAVAVFGNLELGPDAEVGGDIVAVGGTIIRDPQAVTHGGIHQISLGGDFGRMEWLRPWIRHALLLGRPLAIEPGLGWAWSVALGFLALYVLIALFFGRSVEKCVDTLEAQPGQSVVAALLTVLLTPVLIVLLCITVIGIVLVPFVGMGLFCAGLFGKAVILGSLGRRVTGFVGIGAFSHISFAVLVGGIIVLGIYLVPVLGFIAYKLIGILGLGVVVYTLLLAAKAKRESTSDPSPPAAANPSATSASFTPVASASPVSAGPLHDSAPPTGSDIPSAPSAAPALAATALPKAGFWIRMAALFIDAVLVGIIANVLSDSGEGVLVLLAVYGAVMWRLKGTTIGGIICSLRVVRIDGRAIEWDTAIVRALSCFVSLVPAGLGFLWIVFDPERQSWHDKIAGTVVVRAPGGVSLL